MMKTILHSEFEKFSRDMVATLSSRSDVLAYPGFLEEYRDIPAFPLVVFHLPDGLDRDTFEENWLTTLEPIETVPDNWYEAATQGIPDYIRLMLDHSWYEKEANKVFLVTPQDADEVAYCENLILGMME